MRLFHICTVTNDREQYAAMQASFIAAGFDQSRCRYTLFDNSQGNVYEPYSVISRMRAETPEPYLIVCHQDLLLNQGHGYDQLVKALAELDRCHPCWAIAGNAGINHDYRPTLRLNDPNRVQQWAGRFPVQVQTLDENFLVIKTAAPVGCSPELSGFHFYGADLCLNAQKQGYSCYVIDFHLTHLSEGNPHSAAFMAARHQFQARWNREFNFCCVQTTCNTVILSRYPWLRHWFDDRPINRVFISQKSLPFFRTWVNPKRAFATATESGF